MCKMPDAHATFGNLYGQQDGLEPARLEFSLFLATKLQLLHLYPWPWKTKLEYSKCPSPRHNIHQPCSVSLGWVYIVLSTNISMYQYIPIYLG